MIKMYRVFNTHDHPTTVHEYDIIKSINSDGNEEIVLFRSFDDVWSEDKRGEEIIKLIDTGDAVIYPKKMYTGEVDYAMHAELYILLAFLNKTEHMPLFKGTIEEVVAKNNIEI